MNFTINDIDNIIAPKVGAVLNQLDGMSVEDSTIVLKFATQALLDHSMVDSSRFSLDDLAKSIRNGQDRI